MSLKTDYDISAYLSQYEGQNMLDRLYFIASNFDTHRLECLKRLIDIVKTTKSYRFYNKIYDNFQSHINELGTDYAYDKDYVSKYERELKDLVNQIEGEIFTQKSLSNKDQTRVSSFVCV